MNTKVNESFIPVFVRGGSILPYGPNRQYTAEKTNQPLQIRVYTGADATFTLYEDDGQTNAYEQGAQSRILLQWDETQRRLTIGARKGSYPGMEKQQKMQIMVNGQPVKTIVYKGKKTTINI